MQGALPCLRAPWHAIAEFVHGPQTLQGSIDQIAIPRDCCRFKQVQYGPRSKPCRLFAEMGPAKIGAAGTRMIMDASIGLESSHYFPGGPLSASSVCRHTPIHEGNHRI